MPCIIKGCKNRGRHNIGVRLRRPSTRAIWAPNTNALLCDEHATQGLQITMKLTPTNSQKIETHVSSPGGHVVTRRTRIIKRAKER
jgi:hypothetical protein